MISEAKESKQETEVKHPVPKQQTQELTDLTSFNAYAVVTLSDSQQVNVQITSRHGIPADRAYQDFKEFVKLLDLCAVDSSVKFWDGKRSGLSEGATNGSSSTPAASNGGKTTRKWDEPVPQAELPAELAEVTVNVYTQEFDVVKVLPQPDDKATVEFWKDGLKFAVGAKINKGRYDTIKQYLAGLTEQAIDPAKAGEYRIAGVQYWTQGAEYEYKGEKKNYKNIALLKPAL